MPITTMPIYTRSWAHYPLLLPQTAHSDFLSYGGQKFEKRGRQVLISFFKGLTLEDKYMALLNFLLFRCVFEAIFKIKVSTVS
jgi:hypothetical protein